MATKDQLRARLRDAHAAAAADNAAAEAQIRALTAQVGQLTHEVKTMRQHWRQIPIEHPFDPAPARCQLCDEPRDSPRHTRTPAPDLLAAGLGEANYGAYTVAVGGKTHDGHDMPAWSDLSGQTRAGWCAGAVAAAFVVQSAPAAGGQ